MKKTAFVILFAFLCSAGTRLLAKDVDLDRDAQKMDSDTKASQVNHAQTLATEFNVPVQNVTDLRESGKGWGSIRIELALAQQLSKTQPNLYPTTTDALSKVSELRAQGNGYGVIAHDLGVNVGDVQRTAKMDKPAKPEKIQKPAHPEHPEHSMHPEHPEHMDHPDKPAH